MRLMNCTKSGLGRDLAEMVLLGYRPVDAAHTIVVKGQTYWIIDVERV